MDVKSPRFFVTVAVIAAGAMFGALLVESLGLFGFHASSRSAVAAAPALSLLDDAAATPTASKIRGGSAPAAARSSSAVVAKANASSGGVDLADENRMLRSENKKLQERLVAVLNWILANFKGKYPLPETYMSRLQVPAVADDGTLHPEAAEFLKLKPEEQQTINDALAFARKYLAEIEAAIIMVTNPRPDKVVLHIPRFAEDGKVLKDDLYAALEITMGADRFDRFLKVSESGLKSSFYQFGEASRTMVFELVYVGDEKTPQLKVKDGWVVELGPNSHQVTATETVCTNLPAKYAAYLAWLPDYVAAYANP